MFFRKYFATNLLLMGVRGLQDHLVHDNLSLIKVNQILKMRSFSHCVDISYVFLYLIFRPFKFIGLSGGSRNVYFQFFYLQVHFPLITTPLIQIFLQPWWEIHVFEKIYNHGEMKAHRWNPRSIEVLEDVSFRVILKD